MRLILIFALLITTANLQAQTNILQSKDGSLQQRNYSSGNRFIKDSLPEKKWIVSRFVGMSTSVGFFNGGTATIVSVPVGIQVNRKLSNNWYAFAGISAAPSYINFNQRFLSSNFNKGYSGNQWMTANRFDLLPRAELGLMYVNDQKTFSISGSISVEKSTYTFGNFNQYGAMQRFPFIGRNQ